MYDRKNLAINKIWKVLKIAESAMDINNHTTWNDFNSYLLKLCVQYKGAEDTDLYELMNGLRLMSLEHKLTHDLIRNIVFHCINIINKRG